MLPEPTTTQLAPPEPWHMSVEAMEPAVPEESVRPAVVCARMMRICW
ncbi:MAG TPA: hypothetical protein VFU55_00985 [Terracidiphilus sp.]|nr:hypothetical protein [Terracidiphilus sp.]